MTKHQRNITDMFTPVPGSDEHVAKAAKLEDRIQWTVRDSLFIGRWREPLQSHDKIAAFDFDGTLAGVQGTYVYPKNGNDWVWKHNLVPKVIAQLHSKGWRIVILSNQKGILDDGNKSRLRKAAFMGRIKNVIEGIEKETGLEIPVQIYASTGDDIYRKPRRGMWDAMLKDWSSHDIDISKSFYVGDAAGRPQSWVRGHKEDFADTDMKFAVNAGIPFFVPEHVFHNHALITPDKDHEILPLNVAELPTLPRPEFHPPSLSLLGATSSTQTSPMSPTQAGQELILLVGPPASGKTYYFKTFLEDLDKFVHIYQDTLNTKVRCLAQTAKALDSGKSVVVDNTNPDKITRRQYIKVAKSRHIPVRCIYFTVPEKICKHNNAYREFHQNEKKRVPSIAYATFYNRLDSPRLTEGFREIDKIEWAPQFVDDVDKKAWEMFYF